MAVSINNQTNIQKLQNIPDCDILVLPEMWNCPYHNEALQNNNQNHDESLHALIQLAQSKKIWIVGGSISANSFNRCYIIDDTGTIVCTYDKTHLFEFHGQHNYCEKDVFKPGNHFQCFDTPWGKCGVLLCYDIRFCEVSRILSQNGAKILFCPAAFNEVATKKHWKLFLRTRALENEVYLCGVAPAQYTYKNYISGGHSMVVSPLGDILLELDEKEHVEVIDIDLNQIQKARHRMPYWDIRRNDLYQLEERKSENNSNSRN